MKVPFLPIFVDEFRGASTSEGSTTGVHHVHFLSHFHTDHMVGLSATWGYGFTPGGGGGGIGSASNQQRARPAPASSARRVLFCSRITRALLTDAFGEQDLGPYVVALPLFEWVSVPVSDSYMVRCCLLPSCHIPGSVQFLFDTFLGTLLYTGDVKWTPRLLRIMSVVSRMYPIQHVFLDDTWLHLDESRSSKFLSETELHSAFSSVAKRLGNVTSVSCTLQEDEPQPQHRRNFLLNLRRPYCLRVYLHNHFGKEVVLQSLAAALHPDTTILVDEDRYRRLVSVAATFPSTAEEESYEVGIIRSRCDRFCSEGHRVTCGMASFVDDVLACRDAERIDLKWFVSPATMVATLSVTTRCVPVIGLSETPQRDAARPLDPVMTHSATIEVVNSRSYIMPQVLAGLTASTGTPHFAAIMSGWARMQGSALLEGNDVLWNIPFSLHSAAAETVEAIRIMKPLSVTPLVYRKDASKTVFTKLAKYMKEPFQNTILSTSSLRDVPIPLSLTRYVFGESHREDQPADIEASVVVADSHPQQRTPSGSATGTTATHRDTTSLHRKGFRLLLHDVADSPCASPNHIERRRSKSRHEDQTSVAPVAALTSLLFTALDAGHLSDTW